MIYVVEDDNSIRELILYALEGQNYEVKGFIILWYHDV